MSAISKVKAALNTEMKIFNEDGTLNEAAVAELPTRMFHLAIDVISVDPVVNCLLTGDLQAQIKQMVDLPVFRDLFAWMVTNLMDLWQKIQPVVDAVIGSLAEKFNDFINVLVPAKNEIDVVVSNAIDTFCAGVSKTLYHHVSSLDKKISSLDKASQKETKKAVCMLTKPGADPALQVTAVVTAVLTFVSKQVTAFINEHVYQPMLTQLVRLIGQAQGSLMQLIDGLCGLIPEAGGPICMLITVPLGNVAQQLIGELTSGAVNGLMGAAQSWIDSQIPTWSAAIAAQIVPVILKVEGSIQGISNEVKEFRGGALPALAKSMRPVLEIVQKFMMGSLEAVFPNIMGKIKECDQNLATLLDLVQHKLECGAKSNPDSAFEP